ncbi:MAG: replicative DNA helicase [candidate division WOR-3 bacterium]|nr:replicative DNA helicase [candidate division WOR-3 bacterium]
MSVERKPPQALDAEAAVLGAMLLDPEGIPKALQYINEECFYLQSNRKVFKAVVSLFEKNKPADFVTVADELNRMKELENVGGKEFLSSLLESVLTAAHIEEHAKLVLEKSVQRRLIQSASQIVQESFDDSKSADALLDRAEQLIFDIKEKNIRKGFLPLKELLRTTVKTIEDLHEKRRLITGVETGYYELDERTCGFQPSDFIIIAGRPSMGKTSLALNIGVNAALRNNVPIAVFSLEMSKDMLAQRIICAEAHISLRDLRRGRLTRRDWTKLTTALGPISQARIFIDDSAALPVLEIRAKARRLKSEEPDLGMVIIDYLQLIEGARDERLAKSRQQEISDISRALKAMSKELNLPVVALSQLSRMPERREPKKPKPQLSDLRESGAIEQEADLVMLLYRDEFYNRETPDKGIAEVNIAKQRNGPVGSFKLAFLADCMRFENLARIEEPEAEITSEEGE